MKKIIIGCCLFCFIVAQVSAQIPTFVKGDNVVSAGIGFGGVLYSGYDFAWNTVTRTPAFTASFEHCILDNIWDENSSIGIGGQIGYSYIKWNNSDLRIHNTSIAARGSLHYTFVDKLDVYAGLMLGIKFVSHNTDVKYVNQFAHDFYAGARYYFANNIAGFAEVGYWTLFNMGIALKF